VACLRGFRVRRRALVHRWLRGVGRLRATPVSSDAFDDLAQRRCREIIDQAAFDREVAPYVLPANLMASGAPADMPRALYAYNHSWAYVDKVLAYAAAYGYVEPTSIPARAVELARSRIGAPYVWGAEGPDAFDCSGLVLWVYEGLGLEVPRTAHQQFEWAVPIEPSQLQPGGPRLLREHLPLAGPHHPRGHLRGRRDAGDGHQYGRLCP
jgi:cell wall-associated NlpC family hydrolase